MKRFILLIVTLLPLSAHAAERACCYEEKQWYVGGSVMGILPQTVDLDESIDLTPTTGYKLKAGFGISALVGYQLFPNASFELEYIMQRSEFDGLENGTLGGAIGEGVAEQRNQALMLNHRWVYRNAGLIAPYLGAGIGGMKMEVPLIRTVGGQAKDLEDTVLAYQFMAGANFAIPDSKFEFYLGYRYMGMQEGEVGYSSGYKVTFRPSSHNLELGVRLHF